MRSNISYFTIGLIIFIAALVLITAGHWNEVSLLFQTVKSGLFSELGPMLLTVGAIAYLLSLLF